MRGALTAIGLTLALAGGAAMAQAPHGAVPANAPAQPPATSGALPGTPGGNLPEQPRMPDAVAAEYGYGIREAIPAPAPPPPASAEAAPEEPAVPGGRVMIFTFIVAGLVALGVMVMAAARAWRQRDDEAEAH
mgnify:FL=1